jgi:hypothetical protein
VTRTNGSFELPTWQDDVYAAPEGRTFSRVSLTKVWSGGIVGESSAELVMMVADSGAAAYVGIERLDVAVDGRKGTFAFAHVARGDEFSVAVVDGSGTGELDGLAGTLQITVSPEGEHTYELDYTL